MRKKVGWIWIIGAILLFIVNFLTLGNQSFIKVGWASTMSVIVGLGLVICPILILAGIAILILGKKEK